MSENLEDAGSEDREETPRDTEAVLLSIWRRALEEGCGPEMSLAEAAAVLGSSVNAVRRRVAEGIIPAYRDARGRLRIVPRLPSHAVASVQDGAEATGVVAWLREELKRAHEQLNQAVVDRAVLQRDVSNAEQHLIHMREEVAAMWRLLSARTSEAKPGRPARSSPVQNEISRMQQQIAEVRKLAKRRKWPWALLDSA
jgi:hypothetical protein